MSKTIRLLIFVGVLIAVDGQNSENNNRQGKLGFLKGATSMLSSLAQDLVTRSASNSQVLSLNLTNLFILLVLKAIVFGAGAFGYGHGSYGHGGGYGRSAENFLKENLSESVNFNEFLSETELLMMLSFLKADSTKDYGCLQRVVCQRPRKAQEYALTGKLFLKGSELFIGSQSSSNYENALSQVEEAINYGLSGRSCLQKYRCDVS